ncbi:MAG TPA: DUF6468 domain-containing protein [Phenylobacterium sp.]|jgi:hypothetical protein|uniref:DUF6468 domain-containing protein n=1 Tax=Phenylobacterium sp. TaxID=1871053 RepID=UPI002D49B307|nr:DUF6468 domain-containing protein [Phenylobacterium sp.]HZZ66969.1 DUF6468 domain-containing protein [Phenylobacterium sp.]
MSMIGLAMNGLLAVLLLAALTVGLRLNRRLKALRDSHEGFAAAVGELNVAAARAEQGLADLRAATDEAVDLLADRIEKGRVLAMKLERLVEHAGVPQRQAAAPAPAPAATPDDPVAERRLGALLAAAREMRPERVMPPVRAEVRAQMFERAPLETRQAPQSRRLAEDELFDDEPLILDAIRGARR